MEINPSRFAAIKPLKADAPGADDKVQKAKELKQAYQDFIGKTFFGQMMKSMRSSVGKPAYFDGGRTEEVFGAQLDQVLADHMTVASADKFAEPMFRHEFPQQAELLDRAEEKSQSSLTDLSSLRRR